MKRCDWCEGDSLYTQYHDEEWGKPVYDDRILFEFLVLESMQAGLSWITILRKRENFREAFDDFDPKLISQYDEVKIKALLENKGIIRHRKKIESAINNAKLYLQIQDEHGSFSNFIWSYVDHNPIVNHYDRLEEVPTKTTLSDRISKDMKKRGFKFLGSVIMYSYLQAVGLINDHLDDCIAK